MSDEADINEVELDPTKTDDEGEEDFSPFDDLAEEYSPGPIMKVEGSDGLYGNYVPKQQTESDIPVLSTDTLVCMGNTARFVIRDSFGVIQEEFEPEEVERNPDGSWYILNEQGVRVIVEPIRPPCKHYVRQSTQFDYNPEARIVKRLCAARRTTEGAFMSVSDRGMFACSMREPRDLLSEQQLDDFDHKKIEQGKRRVHLPIKV